MLPDVGGGGGGDVGGGGGGGGASDEHLAAPLDDVVPVGQAAQVLDEVAPAVDEKVPASQSRHLTNVIDPSSYHHVLLDPSWVVIFTLYSFLLFEVQRPKGSDDSSMIGRNVPSEYEI